MTSSTVKKCHFTSYLVHNSYELTKSSSQSHLPEHVFQGCLSATILLNLCFDPPSLYSMSFSLFQLPLRSYLFALGSMLRDASFTDQRSDLSTTTVHTVPASTRPDTDYNTCRSTPSPITPMR
ncbi:uncharacterized protein YALI1_C16099g [Yarrowia lipolytica]|uniref:Uncharacterized protein n=1 Tax=Yarrowia lipolytica TaxID=4952 RepID=A0A1D8NAM9_YARLL|nr:hypothetical protein YALI1_C16099g [Yarrowia lipolytica]